MLKVILVGLVGAALGAAVGLIPVSLFDPWTGVPIDDKDYYLRNKEFIRCVCMMMGFGAGGLIGAIAAAAQLVAETNQRARRPLFPQGLLPGS